MYIVTLIPFSRHLCHLSRKPVFKSKGGDYTQSIAPGLPDITGQFRDSGYHRGGGYATGAFYNTLSDGDTSNEGASRAGGRYGFAASRSNPIYGRSNTVQPPAIRLILQAKF